jgi:serine/threonine-protein kinase
VAPEQILNFREVKPVSDQYSAAATLYHLLSAQPLHDSTGGTVQVLKRVLSSDPVPLQTRRPELPSGLTAIVHKALARSPEQRYAHVAEFRQALLPFTA